MALLYELASDLGEDLYPALIKLLCAAERFGDAASRRLVCDTLAYAAETWRAPPGWVGAWGSDDREMFEIGPIEYLVIWHVQRGLDRPQFVAALRLMLGICCATGRGRRAQARHVAEAAASALPGTIGPAAAEVIAGLARDLEAGLAPGPMAERAAAAARGVAPPVR